MDGWIIPSATLVNWHWNWNIDIIKIGFFSSEGEGRYILNWMKGRKKLWEGQVGGG